MKVILYMAISANGIIAGEDGNEDFLSNINWEEFVSLLKDVGCYIWGRKTYEAARSWDKKYMQDLAGYKGFILTSDINYQCDENFTVASSPQELIKKATLSNFEKIILSGGSTNNSSFAKENLIDEVIFNVNQVIVGKGIPIFNPQDFELKLEFLELKKINEGIIQLRYKVIK